MRRTLSAAAARIVQQNVDAAHLVDERGDRGVDLGSVRVKVKVRLRLRLLRLRVGVRARIAASTEASSVTSAVRMRRGVGTPG